MKKFILAIVPIFLIVTVSAQQIDSVDNDQLEVYGNPGHEQNNQEAEQLPAKRYDFGLQAGTSFTYASNYYYGPSVYIAPEFSYFITPRLKVSVGIGLEQSRLYPLNADFTDNEFLPMTRAFLYARGSYQLSPRLTVYSSVYQTINDVPNRHPDRNSYHSMNMSGMDFGLQYNISKSFSVGFQLRSTSGAYPYYPGTGLIPPDAYVPVPGF